MVLARMLEGPAAGRAPGGAREGDRLNPRLSDAYDLRASLLAEAGRFDEAPRRAAATTCR